MFTGLFRLDDVFVEFDDSNKSDESDGLDELGDFATCRTLGEHYAWESIDLLIVRRRTHKSDQGVQKPRDVIYEWKSCNYVEVEEEGVLEVFEDDTPKKDLHPKEEKRNQQRRLEVDVRLLARSNQSNVVL